MVNLVGRGSDKDIFDPARKFSDVFGVDPELKKWVYCVNDHIKNRMKPKQQQRNEKYGRHLFKPGLAEVYPEVVMVRAMMRDVDRPPQPGMV